MVDFDVPEEFLGKTVVVFLSVPTQTSQGLSFPSFVARLKASVPGALHLQREQGTGVVDTLFPKANVQEIVIASAIQSPTGLGKLVGLD